MAPLITATLPLHNCRTGNLLAHRLDLDRAQHRDSARLRAAVEADAAAGTLLSGIVRGMDAICIHPRQQLQALRRAGVHTQPAALALVLIDLDRPAWFGHDSHLTSANAWFFCSHFVRSQYS